MSGHQGDLHMGGAGGELWVMKVPKFLMEHLQAANDSGAAALGSVQAEDGNSSSGSTGGPSGPDGRRYTLTLPEQGLPEGLPRDYELRFSAPPPATYIFSRGGGADDGAVAAAKHEGRVAVRGEIRPRELSGAYRSLLKARGESADAPRRSMGIVMNETDIKRQRLDHRGVQRDEQQDRLRRQEQKERNTQKRSRQVSARKLKEELMELFATQSHWSRRDLITKLGNADTLGACLDEICVKVTKKGTHYGDYMLKETLRSGVKVGGGAGTSTAGGGPLG